MKNSDPECVCDHLLSEHFQNEECYHDNGTAWGGYCACMRFVSKDSQELRIDANPILSELKREGGH